MHTLPKFSSRLRSTLLSPQLLALLLLAGCAVGPDYTPPELATPVAELPQPLDAATTLTLEETAAWWNAFEDPLLTRLVHQSLSSNRTLRAAAAAVRESRARLTIARAPLFPQVDAGGNITRWRNSDNGTTGPGHGDSYRAGFDAAWEVDLFGRNRRASEAATATLEADYANLENTWVTLAAETALTYVQLQTTRRQLDVAATNLLVQTQTLDLISSRNASGISNGLATEQARYILEQTRATIPRLLADEESLLNSLAVLTGAMPGELPDDLTAVRPIPEIPPRLLVGIPSDLLRRRPDIRRAERLLAAQTARIGQATADLYPSLTLFGSVGLESLNSGDFFNWSSRFWSILPQVSWPIFHGGSIRANINVQTALQEQALAYYEQTVLDAVAELRTALAAYGREYARRDALLSGQESAQQALNLAQDQFLHGLSDFNSVLDAQRALLTFGETIAASDGLITQNLIRVYKALGGGWQPFEM